MLLLRPAVAAALVALHLPAQATPEPNDWTVLVYGCQDNDSEESFGPDMADLRAGLVAPGGVQVFCLVDRSPKYSDSAHGFGENFDDTRLYHLTRESAVRVDGGEQLPEITAHSTHEADTGDAVTVRQFVRWAKAHHPARNYALIFYSHGNGVRWCPDEQSGSDLFPAELTDVLGEEDSLDLVVFDVCEMSGIENAYQWRPRPGVFSVDVVVGTPMAGFPFPWHRIMRRIRPGESPAGEEPWHDPTTLTAEDFGRLVVDETRRHREFEISTGEHPAEMVRVVQREAMSCLDLRRSEQVKDAVDDLARALAADETGKEVLGLARGSANADSQAVHYNDTYVDLYDLAERLARADVSAEITQRAGAVRDATDALVVHSYGLAAYEGFEPGKHGVYVVLPRETGPTTWQRWYHPSRPQGQAGLYGNYAWCRDGAEAANATVENWFELLDAWYDTDDDAGGGNGYRW